MIQYFFLFSIALYDTIANTYIIFDYFFFLIKNIYFFQIPQTDPVRLWQAANPRQAVTAPEDGGTPSAHLHPDDAHAGCVRAVP